VVEFPQPSAVRIRRNITKEPSEISQRRKSLFGSGSSSTGPCRPFEKRAWRGLGRCFRAGGVGVSTGWGARRGPWRGRRASGFWPLYVGCLKLTALGSVCPCWWDPYFTCSISLVVNPRNPRRAPALLEPWQLRVRSEVMPGCCRFCPARGRARRPAAAGLRNAHEGSRKPGDALGSASGSEEEEVWRSRCPSARQDVCPAAAPGQDTSLCPAKGAR